MSGNPVLSLLGLALRGGRLEMGDEPVSLAVKAGRVRLLLLASDAAGNILRRAEHLAEEGHCLWLITPFPKAELGGALGRGSVAIAALTDLGLAAAVCQRLAAMDPERYESYVTRMELKQRRAKERKASPRPASSPKRKPSQNSGPRDGKSAFSKDRPRDGKPALNRDHPRDGKPAFGKDRPRDGKPALNRDHPRDGKPAFSKDRPRDGKSSFNKDHPRKGKPAFSKDRPYSGKPSSNNGWPGKRSPGGRRGGGR